MAKAIRTFRTKRECGDRAEKTQLALEEDNLDRSN
jgi:hypothetical protein